MAIDGIPPEFVAGAVKRFIRGEVKRERHAFLPTAPELAIEARRLKNEAGAANYVALPKPVEKPISAEERAKVAKLFAGLAKTIEPKRETFSLSAEQELELLAAQPIRISSALLEKIAAKENAA